MAQAPAQAPAQRDLLVPHIREASLDVPLIPPPWPTTLETGAQGKRALVIDPIATLGELIEEGQRMQHCVASRLYDALEGSAWFFSASVGKTRLTVEVRAGSNGWRISEMRRFANRSPTRAEYAAVEAWLDAVTQVGAAAPGPATHAARPSPPARS